MTTLCQQQCLFELIFISCVFLNEATVAMRPNTVCMYHTVGRRPSENSETTVLGGHQYNESKLIFPTSQINKKHQIQKAEKKMDHVCYLL